MELIDQQRTSEARGSHDGLRGFGQVGFDEVQLARLLWRPPCVTDSFVPCFLQNKATSVFPLATLDVSILAESCCLSVWLEIKAEMRGLATTVEAVLTMLLHDACVALEGTLIYLDVNVRKILVRLSFGVVARIVLTILWSWVSGINERPMLVQESNLVKNGGEVRHFLVKPMRHGERAV